MRPCVVLGGGGEERTHALDLGGFNWFITWWERVMGPFRDEVGVKGKWAQQQNTNNLILDNGIRMNSV